MTPNNTNTTSSVCSALEILNYLTGKDWCKNKEIASGLGMDVSKVHRLLNTMLAYDFVRYDPVTRRYQLGLKFFTLAYHMSQTPLISASKVHMEKAASELFCTLNLGILNNSKTEVIIVLRIEGNPSIGVPDTPVGVNKAVHASAIGKCILSRLPIGEQQAVIKTIHFVKYTENTLTNTINLQKNLNEINDRGYSIDQAEFNEHLFCFAKPIYDHSGQVVAAVSVSLYEQPADVFKEKILDVLNLTAKQISFSLGYKL